MRDTVDAPLITTVIPTYRRPALLKRAILSVLAQTYPHFRVLVCDNASGDETSAVVAELAARDPRVLYHRHAENIGSYNNFNWGLQAVDTPFFSLLSDDDFLMPTFFEVAMRGFERYPAAAISAQNSIVIGTNKQILSGPVGPEGVTFFPAGAGFEPVQKVQVPATWTGMVFRREVRDAIGVMDLATGPFADGGYVLHAVARLPMVASPDVGAVLLAHFASTSGSMQPLSGEWPGWWDRMARHIEEDLAVPAALRARVRELIFPDFRRIGYFQVMRALADGDMDFARRATQGLADCGHYAVAAFLRIFAWGCGRIPGVMAMLRMIKRRRRHHLMGKQMELTRRYDFAVNYLNTLDELAGLPGGKPSAMVQAAMPAHG